MKDCHNKECCSFFALDDDDGYLFGYDSEVPDSKCFA